MALKYPSYSDRFLFVELLGEGGSHSVQAEVVHLGSWVTAGEIPVVTAIDPAGAGMRIVEDLAPRETSFVVEVETMKVVHRSIGLSALYAALDSM